MTHSKIINARVLFVLICWCLSQYSFAQLHSAPGCGTSFNLSWDNTPTANNEFDWTPDGSLSQTLVNVDNSGVSFTISYTGDVGSLSNWNGLGGPNTPGVGTNASDGTTEVLEYFTTGFSSTGITITLSFSRPITDIGFDLFHINGAGPNGDLYTITATNTLSNTVFPTFTSSATPSYTTNNGTGVVDSDNNSVAGDNDQVGINFSDVNGINSITLVWDECSGCTAGTAHGSALGNMDFCAAAITQPPFAKNDSATTTTNQQVVIDLLANDDDPNNDIVNSSTSLISGGMPSNGSASIDSGSGALTYTPNSGYSGNDTLFYRVCDSTSPTPLCDTARVTIQISADFDGDGILDITDIDDDNDGIYDTQEICGTDPALSLGSGTINVFIDLDRDEDETSWTLTGPSGTIASGNSYEDGDDIIDNDYVITENGTYTFTISDIFGDGLTFNTGSDENMASSYSISLDGVVVYSSGASPSFFNSSHDIVVTLQQNLFSCLSADPADDEDDDGIPNYRDADFCTLNANGVCASMDADGDGIINSLDLDADNDGIPDIAEAQGVDTDGNGQVDSFTDIDQDGLHDTYDPSIPTVVSGWSTTGDCSGTTLNYVHNVSLNPGSTDLGSDVELTFCMTGDYGNPANTEEVTVAGEGGTNIGTFNITNSDNNAYSDCFASPFCITTTISQANWNLWNDDGQVDLSFTAGSGVNICADYSCLGNVSTTYRDTISNSVVAYPDTDNDGIADALDLDADNDGIADLLEAGGVDANGDGFVDNLSDGDGDGYTDLYDPDDDGIDGIDSGEGNQPLVKTNGSGSLINGNSANSLDTDGDGLADHIDLDADNDGIPDLVEAGGIDTDGNGIVDVSTDNDNDGYADTYDPDDDGTPGIDNATDPLMMTGGTDTNGNGHADETSIIYINGNAQSADFDGDGRPDHLDLDADNDGIPDLVEAGASDPENDGMVDTAAIPWDADGDGLADVYDENVVGGVALIKTSADNNGDGILNGADQMIAGGSNRINTDGTGQPNHLDLDSDDDGITDVVENAAGSSNADNGGSGDLSGTVHNYTDSGNNDGWHDSSNSTTLDTDSDGIPDYLDIDADNDGIPDYKEGVCSSCPSAGGPSGGDSDGDGVLDLYNLSGDNSSAGSNIGVTPHLDDDDLSDIIPDYLDTDTDDDTARDWSEGYDVNNNETAMDDILVMAASYEAANGSPGHYPSIADAPSSDPDGDGVPNWLDNQPGTVGINENLRPPFLDGTSPFWIDTDQDGLVDIFDTSEGGTNAPTPDNNTANDFDWRDQIILAFLPVELAEFWGEAIGCKIQINWIAETEENFDYYILEWSQDSRNFEALQQTQGVGGAGSNAYQYTDANAAPLNFYRLKMVDLDGTFEYSEVITIKTDCDDQKEISVFPNPQLKDHQHITLKWYASKSEEVISIMDQSGRVLRRMNLPVEQSWNTIRLDISDLAAGMYFVKIGSHRKPQSFVIQQ